MPDDDNLGRLEAAFRESQQRHALSDDLDDLVPPLVTDVSPQPPTVDEIADAFQGIPRRESAAGLSGQPDVRRRASLTPPTDDRVEPDASAIDLDTLRSAIRAELSDAVKALPRPEPTPPVALDLEPIRTMLRDEIAAALAEAPAGSRVDLGTLRTGIHDDVATIVAAQPVPPDVLTIRSSVHQVLVEPLAEMAASLEAITLHAAADDDGSAEDTIVSRVERLLAATTDDLRRDIKAVAADQAHQIERALDGLTSLKQVASELHVAVAALGSASTGDAPDPDGASGLALSASHQLLARQVSQLATDLAAVLQGERDFLVESIRESAVPGRMNEIVYQLERVERRLGRGRGTDDSND